MCPVGALHRDVKRGQQQDLHTDEHNNSSQLWGETNLTKLTKDLCISNEPKFTMLKAEGRSYCIRNFIPTRAKQ